MSVTPIAPSPLALGTSFFVVIVFCMFTGFYLFFKVSIRDFRFCSVYYDNLNTVSLIDAGVALVLFAWMLTPLNPIKMLPPFKDCK